jgi:peroxin-16
VVSSYHDTLLGRRLTKSLSLPPHPFTGPSPTSSTDEAASTSAPRVVPLLPPPSEHMRYTRYWTDRSPVYKRASRALSTLTYLELLMEMLARRKGNDRIRWRVILVIEAIKYVPHLFTLTPHISLELTPRTCLRMIILGITRRPVLTPAVPQREFDITSLSPSIISEATKPIPSSSSTPAIESISPGAPLRSHLYQMSGSLPESHLPHPLTLMPEMTTAAFAAEILTSTATLVQVLLLLKTQVISS